MIMPLCIDYNTTDCGYFLDFNFNFDGTVAEPHFEEQFST